MKKTIIALVIGLLSGIPSFVSAQDVVGDILSAVIGVSGDGDKESAVLRQLQKETKQLNVINADLKQANESIGGSLKKIQDINDAMTRVSPFISNSKEVLQLSKDVEQCIRLLSSAKVARSVHPDLFTPEQAAFFERKEQALLSDLRKEVLGRITNVIRSKSVKMSDGERYALIMELSRIVRDYKSACLYHVCKQKSMTNKEFQERKALKLKKELLFLR